MLTDNKEISTAAYWSKIYEGKNDNAAVDASNTVRAPNPFDRFGWVVGYADKDDNRIIEVGAGHARICERLKSLYPYAEIIASDQCEAAMTISRFRPYIVCSAYDIPFTDKYFDLLIAAQCLEYMEDLDRFFIEAKRVANKLLITVPIYEMQKWSQLYIFTEETVKQLLEPIGTIEVFERHDDLLLVKLKFNDYASNVPRNNTNTFNDIKGI